MNAIAGPVMQIGCIAFGVDLMFGTINGETFPLTNMVAKTLQCPLLLLTLQGQYMEV